MEATGEFLYVVVLTTADGHRRRGPERWGRDWVSRGPPLPAGVQPASGRRSSPLCDIFKVPRALKGRQVWGSELSSAGLGERLWSPAPRSPPVPTESRAVCGSGWASADRGRESLRLLPPPRAACEWIQEL